MLRQDNPSVAGDTIAARIRKIAPFLTAPIVDLEHFESWLHNAFAQSYKDFISAFSGKLRELLVKHNAESEFITALIGTRYVDRRKNPLAKPDGLFNQDLTKLFNLFKQLPEIKKFIVSALTTLENAAESWEIFNRYKRLFQIIQSPIKSVNQFAVASTPEVLQAHGLRLPQLTLKPKKLSQEIFGQLNAIFNTLKITNTTPYSQLYRLAYYIYIRTNDPIYYQEFIGHLHLDLVSHDFGDLSETNRAYSRDKIAEHINLLITAHTIPIHNIIFNKYLNYLFGILDQTYKSLLENTEPDYIELLQEAHDFWSNIRIRIAVDDFFIPLSDKLRAILAKLADAINTTTAPCSGSTPSKSSQDTPKASEYDDLPMSEALIKHSFLTERKPGVRLHLEQSSDEETNAEQELKRPRTENKRR